MITLEWLKVAYNKQLFRYVCNLRPRYAFLDQFESIYVEVFKLPVKHYAIESPIEIALSLLYQRAEKQGLFSWY